jgi:hypothetical protein
LRNTNNSRRSEWTPERVASLSKSAAVLLVAGVVVGLFAIAVNLYYVAAVVAVCGIVLLIAWQFEAALVVYALIAFVPWGETPDLAVGGSGVGKGVYVSELMLGFLLVVWFGKYLLSGLPKRRIPSGFYVPLALYLAYCVLSVVNSYIFWDSHVSRVHQHPHVNIIELGLRFLSAGALVMMATTVTSRKWLTWVSFALFVPAVYNAANALTGARIPIQAPWWSLLALLPAGYLWAIVLDNARSVLGRLLAAGAVTLLMVIVFIQSIAWVSGWLGLFTAIGTVTFLRNRKAFIVTVAVACVLGAAAWPFLHENVIEESKTGGDYDRFALMAGAVKYATTFPLGVGLGNYRTYNTFHYGQKWGTTSYSSAHGSYSQHLSETGFVGLALFVVVLASGFAWVLRNYRSMPPSQSRTFLLAVLGQMMGIAVAAVIGDYIIPTYHNGGLTTFSATVYSWIIWGLAIAHVRISKSETDGSVDINSELEYARSA